MLMLVPLGTLAIALALIVFVLWAGTGSRQASARTPIASNVELLRTICLLLVLALMALAISIVIEVWQNTR